MKGRSQGDTGERVSPRGLGPGARARATLIRVEVWELDNLRVAAHHPEILRSDDDANRVIALLLPGGESLQEHQVHEHALVFVVRGELAVSSGASERTLTAPSLIHFDPGERHEVER